MLDSKNTEDGLADSPSGGLSLNDIYFVIFRRKWIILFLTLLGVIAAGVLFVRHKPIYRSDSKLLVRYVVESKGPLMPPGGNTQVRSPDFSGNSIINSETEILTSLDLCIEVAETVGSAAILKSMGGGDDKILAGAVISTGITVEVPPRSSIMKVTFRHHDPEIIRPVLERLIEAYLKRHAEIHRGLGSLDNVLSQQADQLRFQLSQTEEKLREVKAKAGVISLEETKSTYIQEMSSLRKELYNTEAELAEARAAITAGSTNTLSLTHTISTGRLEIVEADVPPDILNQYRDLISRLAALRNKEFALRSQFSDENSLVKRAREQVTEADQQRKDLEKAHPALLKAPMTPLAATPSEIGGAGFERARAIALDAKAKTLRAQLEDIRGQAAKLDEIETQVKQLQRKRDLEEENYRYLSAGLERSRFDEALGSSRDTNISVIQKPTPARKDDSKRLKMAGSALAGGLAAGLALAFLLELFLDQTVRRAPEVEGRLHIPLFMAIPYANGKALRSLARRRKPGTNGSEKETALQPATAWELNHPLRPVFEGLRDRIANHFKRAVHKPKLVGISTCSAGAGATTLAAGLAAALSEGEGKVLLVDLHHPQGAAHPFFKGKHACEISDVLEQEKRQAGLVQENLYMALADHPDRRLGLLAKQFSSLVPKLKASDYDYIIFDMPRVSATSPTLRLAGMMDLTLLVVEAGKVPREAVRQGYSLLAETGAEAQVVLNKVRNYIPARLSGEL